MNLPRIQLADIDRLLPSGSGIDDESLQQAQQIINRVRRGGDAAVREIAQSFGELSDDASLLVETDELASAAAAIDSDVLETLERTAERIRQFAQRQRESLQPLECAIDGGRAGHHLVPVERVGCYVPGGRYPLISTALMTAVTARAAGCERVIVATPRPQQMMLAAAHVAGAEAVLAVGGAQAIAAMAYGIDSLSPVHLIVGPGNRWVTAAKKIVSGVVGIDLLAGPTELVVLADATARPAHIAADLLAQAEHDADARPILVTTHEPLIEKVEIELGRQLEQLSTRETAQLSLQQNGCVVLCGSVDEAIEACNRLAPEHLELMCQGADEVSSRIRHAGCLFWGPHSAEVFGDYGVGPNHTLPTAGTARFSAGLNVMNFIRIRSWIRMDRQPTEQLFEDVCRLAELEGLAAHAAACRQRKIQPS